MNSAARRASATAAARPPAPAPAMAPTGIVGLLAQVARALQRLRQHARRPLYMRCSRVTRSGAGSGPVEGAQVSISPGPRSTSGTAVFSASPRADCPASARASQPVDSWKGCVPPDSSTCCASKCERSR
jgi:hypothetical protein